MTRRLLTLALMLLALPALAQQGPYVLLQVNIPSGLTAEHLPVLADLNLSDVRAALGLQSAPADGMLAAVEGTTSVPAQFSAVSAAAGRLCLLLPTRPAGPRLVKVYLTQAVAAPATPAPLQVTRDGGVVTVTAPDYRIVHDPARNGGLPASFSFPRSGKSFDTVVFNDRLYSKQLQGFRLGDDRQPEVRVIANGPLCTEVQVKARYLHGQTPTPANSRAVYTFTYFAGSPVFRVSGEMTQDTAFSWEQLHFLELYFKDDSFTELAVGEPLQRQAFTNSKDHRGQAYGALLDGRNAIGFLGAALIYDGQADYGRYLHGPWVPWADSRAHYALEVWVGTADDPVAAIAAEAAAGPRTATGTVLTPGLATQLDALRQQGAKAPRQAWLAALLQRAVATGAMGLREATAVAQKLRTSGSGANTLKLGEQTLTLLNTRRLGLALGSTPGRGLQLVSLFDLQRGQETLAAPCEPFSVALLDRARKPAALTSSSFQLVGQRLSSSGDNLHLNWWQPTDKAFEGLTADLSISLQGGLSSWKLAVGNKSTTWSVDRVVLPELKIAPLGADATDDRVLFPNGFGRAYPATSGVSTGAMYPSGSCAMQLLGVYDDHSGVYVAQHDPRATDKRLAIACGADNGASTLRIEVPAENASLPANSYQTAGEVVIGVTDGGGWWPLTRLYRDWLAARAPWWPQPQSYSRDDYPRWLQQTQTWICSGSFPKDCVPQTKAFAEAVGTPTAIHWYNWHVIPFDNQYPHYFPTKEGFRDGVKELQQAGIRVVPYINGRLWDKDTDDFPTDGSRYCTRRPDGEPYIEIYGSKRELVPMCPSQAFWRDKLTDIVMRLVSEEGVDGVYMDQIAAAAPVLCYNREHGHPLAGGHWWVEDYWKLLEPLQKKIAAVSPDKMLTTESNAEPYAKYFDAYLMCNSNSDYEVPLFPAVYGGKILMFGTYSGRNDTKDLSLLALRQGKLFAFGSQLWWGNPGITAQAPALAWLRGLAQLRRQANEYFVHGLMAPPPVFATRPGDLATPLQLWTPNPVTIHTPDLWATAWQLQDKRLLLPLVNITATERVVTLRFDPARYGLKPQARVRVERLNASGVVETVSKQGRWELPVRLGPTEATALRISAG